MFEKFKKFLENIGKGYEYIVDVQTIFEFMKEEINFSIQNNLEACVNFIIYYNGEKHNVSIWNYNASTEPEKGISIKIDNTEFDSLENFINSAKLEGSLIAELNGYLKIELTDSDSVFLNNYKKQHPDIEPNY